MHLFGPKVVAFAVSRVVDDVKEKFRILSRFDKTAFDNIKFKQGDRVIVHGLQNNPTLNGMKGEVLKWLQDQGRYQVKPDEKKNTISVLASNIKLDDADNIAQKRTTDRSLKSRQMQSRARSQYDDTSSSDDDSDLPALTGGNQSSSDDSSEDDNPPPLMDSRNKSSSESDSDSDSDSDSVPSLIEREARSNSSDSSNEDDSDSSMSGPPALTKKDNSSSDDESIPSLISPNQQSSSDESAPLQKRNTNMVSTRNNAEREGGSRGRGRGGRRRRGRGRGR